MRVRTRREANCKFSINRSREVVFKTRHLTDSISDKRRLSYFESEFLGWRWSDQLTAINSLRCGNNAVGDPGFATACHDSERKELQSACVTSSAQVTYTCGNPTPHRPWSTFIWPNGPDIPGRGTPWGSRSYVTRRDVINRWSINKTAHELVSVYAIALEVAPSHVAATDTGTAVIEIATCCDRTWNLQDTLYLRYGASILSLAENVDRNKLNPLRIIYRRMPTRQDSLNASQEHCVGFWSHVRITFLFISYWLL